MGLQEKSPGLIAVHANSAPVCQSGKYFTVPDWALFVEALATLIFHWILKNKVEGLKPQSSIQEQMNSCREPEFDKQRLCTAHDCLQPPVSGDPVSSFAFYGHCVHIVQACMCRLRSCTHNFISYF